MANAAVVVGSSSRIPSFLTSKWTFIVILIRIGISLKTIIQWSEPWIEMVLSNPALQSILVRSTSTLEQWHELQAQHALLGMVPEEYNRKSLLYLFTLPYLEQLGFPSSPAMIAMGIGIFLIVVDFLIAWFIEQLGVYILHSEHKDREELMQPNIPGAIQPNRAAIFGISCDDATSAVPVSIQRSHFPRLGAWIYFCSPLTILCGPQFSFQSLVYLGTIWSCYECSRSKGNVSWAAFVLAVTAYIEPFLLVMALPCYSLTRHSKIFVGLFAGYLASLQILSFLLVGDFTVHLELPVYSHPNLGPLWYFTMHVFPRFRPYFQIMFAGLPYLLVVPLALRLHQYPIVLVGNLHAWHSYTFGFVLTW
jgi:GPI transamidase subunit PIG-U